MDIHPTDRAIQTTMIRRRAGAVDIFSKVTQGLCFIDE